MNSTVCQSCAMPMENEKMMGKNSDGTRNEEYCVYCYEDGKFTASVSMNEMVEICVPHLVEDGMKENEARETMKDVLPKLKRWAMTSK
ncbi:zinc ribbon domain-containing protein [Pseudalkalibacillus sp. R45]|uniref:zinc ribbon domain-containing protein n=1 Tax=Pseudalkalibacillus sp. R45 TaxID=3457433 RepID=UPI003FCD3D92